MTQSLTLAQQHLYTFQACPRRFYLRYLARVPWPEEPLNPELELAYERGRRLHLWIERHFLGLPPGDEAAADPMLRRWWTIFQQQAPSLPDGRRFVESALTVPIGPGGRHRLTGRFDLLIVGDGADGRPAAWLFDWKTGDPRPHSRLSRAWQTRVYLYVLAEGGASLAPDMPEAFAPDRLTLTYWYVEEPDQPRVLTYDAAAHARNRTELEAIVADIDRRLATNDWPLTDELGECSHCAYQSRCGRQASGTAPPYAAEDDELDPEEEWLEPLWG